MNILAQGASKSGASGGGKRAPRAPAGESAGLRKGPRLSSSTRVRAYVGLGANLGDAPATLAAAVHALAALPDVGLRGVSRLYRTRPVGVVDQPDFHNAVVALDVPAGPDPETGALALLMALKQIEAAFGRQKRKRWGPRELDLDLLLFGRHRIRVERPDTAKSADPARRDARWLEVPHPQAQERLFVLAPLADLAPRLTPPGWGESVESLRRDRAQTEARDSVVPIARWFRGWLREEQPEYR